MEIPRNRLRMRLHSYPQNVLAIHRETTIFGVDNFQQWLYVVPHSAPGEDFLPSEAEVSKSVSLFVHGR